MIKDVSNESLVDKKFIGGFLALITVATSLVFVTTRGKETFLPPQDKQGKIEVIAGETHGWISTINSVSGKKNALNLQHICFFWEKSKKETVIRMSSKYEITVNTPYSKVWKRIAQASRK